MSQGFQYPQSGSRRCRTSQLVAWNDAQSDFSTLKAGRDAAAAAGDTVRVVGPEISVPSNRVETLPRILSRPPVVQVHNFSTLKAGRDAAAPRLQINNSAMSQFQYPQSGSRRCRLPSEELTQNETLNFSTLKAGRDAAACGWRSGTLHR